MFSNPDVEDFLFKPAAKITQRRIAPLGQYPLVSSDTQEVYASATEEVKGSYRTNLPCRKPFTVKSLLTGETSMREQKLYEELVQNMI